MSPFQRAARTFLQAFLASLLLNGGGLAAGTIPTAQAFWTILAGAIFAACVAVLSWLQNSLEDSGQVPPVLGK